MQPSGTRVCSGLDITSRNEVEKSSRRRARACERGRRSCARRRLAGGAELHGYNNYPLTHAPVHDGAAQQLHTLVINPRDREDVLHPSRGIPGFAALVDAARELLPAQTADGRDFEFTHAHFLDQCHAIARFRDHQDTEENRKKRLGDEGPKRIKYRKLVRG